MDDCDRNAASSSNANNQELSRAPNPAPGCNPLIVADSWAVPRFQFAVSRDLHKSAATPPVARQGQQADDGQQQGGGLGDDLERYVVHAHP